MSPTPAPLTGGTKNDWHLPAPVNPPPQYRNTVNEIPVALASGTLSYLDIHEPKSTQGTAKSSNAQTWKLAPLPRHLDSVFLSPGLSFGHQRIATRDKPSDAIPMLQGRPMDERRTDANILSSHFYSTTYEGKNKIYLQAHA